MTRRKHTPYDQRFGPWLESYDAAQADLIARHEEHKAHLKRLSLSLVEGTRS